MVHASILLTAALAACLWPTDQSSEGATPGLSMDPHAPPVDTTLVPSADAWTWHPHPNDNFGTTTDLRTGVNGNGRAFLRWDPQAIQAAVGSMTLIAARVEVTLQTSTGWSGSGGQVGLYRMTKDWTELGATDNCAIDAVPGNSHADCSGATAWSLHDPAQAPWGVPPTDSVFLTNGQTGTITFDVTADIVAFLAGTANYGWAFKPTNDAALADVRIGSREAGSPPTLVLTVSLGTWPMLSEYPVFDTTMVVQVQADSDTVAYFRTEIQLYFKSTVSDAQKGAFFTAHAMTVIGTTPSGKFFVKMPDPGPTLQAFYDVLDSLSAEPEIDVVAPIDRYSRRPLQEARYPSDGPGLARTDWFDSSSSTWAPRAIRSPLAWGCEMGDYGGKQVKVGVFEWKHQPNHPEFANSSPKLRSPSDNSAGMSAITPTNASVVAAVERHASTVVGVLSARGDNNSGVAGVAWRTDLHLYAGYSAQDRKLPLTSGFYVLSDSVKADGISVLNFSADDGFAANENPNTIERFIRAAKREIKWLMDDAPCLVIVVAAGNSGFRGTLSDYVRTPNAALIRSGLLLLAAEDPEYRDRIIVVAGTRPGNSLWLSSDFVTGAVDIAAPAEDVTALDRWTGQTGSAVPLRVASGTSLAAPMVAGTVALLLAMDSLLPADSVKGYITDGARWRTAATGGLVQNPQVAGAPEAIWQLDAYEALARASRERRTTTPVCGGQVWAGDTALYVDHGGGTPLRILPASGATWFLAFPSLAQGGRSIAISNLGIETWVVDTRPPYTRTVLPGVYARQYLERGTADLNLVDLPSDPYYAWTLSLTVRGTGTDLTNARLESLVVPPGAIGASVPVIRVSPLGDLAAVLSLARAQSIEESYRWDMVRLTDPPQLAAPIAFWLDPQEPPNCWTDCPAWDGPGDVAWSHDSRRAVFTLWRRDFVATNTVSGVATRVVSAANGGGSVALDSGVVSGAWLLRPRFTPDDSLLVAEHSVYQGGYFMGPPCQERRREPSVPFAERVGAVRDALLADFCFPYWSEQQGPGIFNAPPANMATTAGRAAYRPSRVPRPTRH